MIRKLLLAASAWMAIGWAGASAAPAPLSADSPLAAVPAQAPIVVHIRGVDRVKGRVKATMTAAAPDFGALAAGQVDAMFGQLFEGRKTDAIPANGSAFLAFLEVPGPGGDVPMAVILRVNSYAAFKTSFLLPDEARELKSVADGIDRAEIKGTETFLVDKKDYVILTQKKEYAETLAKQYTGLDGKIAKPLAVRYLEQDLGIYVNLASVNKTYGDQIRQGREFVMTMMDQAGGQLEKGQLEAAKKMYGALFQLVLDGEGMVFGLDFRPEGIALHMQAQVGAETESGQVLKSQKPSGLEQIGKLPGGQLMYTGVDVSPESMRALTSGLQGLQAGEGDAKKLVDAALTQLADAKGKAMYSSMNYPPSGVTFQEYADPGKAVAASIALYKGFGDGAGYMGGVFKSKPEIKTDAEEFRGVKFNHVKLQFDLDKMAELVPGAGDGMKAAYKKVLGDNMNVWFGTDGNRMLTITAKDWAEARGKMEKFLDGKGLIADSQAFQATRKQLPAQASMLYMIDAGPFANWMADYMVTMFKAMPGLPFNLPESIKPVETTSSFIGFSIAMQPERGAIDLYIPVTAVQEIRKVAMQLFMGN
ncbi:MAG: hypothetical protein K1X57_03965 [Gemmataceae bacterium]|nr:hypothetical protein [Gemmataceae bacterium]